MTSSSLSSSSSSSAAGDFKMGRGMVKGGVSCDDFALVASISHKLLSSNIPFNAGVKSTPG